MRGDAKPHESPILMLLPLVVLAIASVVGGGIQLPFSDATHRLEHWLHPVVEAGEAEIEGTWADDNKYLLLLIAAVVTLIGIALAWLVYERRRLRVMEPKVLEHAWYYDEALSNVAGGPGREAFEATAWFDRNVVDGGVRATAWGVRFAATGLRTGQSGFVRASAGIIGIGAVLLLAWFVVVRGIL
ncbi:MAG: hypothetical protein WKF58_15125 [Ilumatobacteraceae bacterium]